MLLCIDVCSLIIKYSELQTCIKICNLNSYLKSNISNMKFNTFLRINTNNFNFVDYKKNKQFCVNEIIVSGHTKIPKIFIIKFFDSIQTLQLHNHQHITNRNLKLMKNLNNIKLCHCLLDSKNYSKLNLSVTSLGNNFQCCNQYYDLHGIDKHTPLSKLRCINLPHTFKKDDNMIKTRILHPSSYDFIDNYNDYTNNNNKGVMARLVQLGAQDVYLTNKPEITFFKFKYNKSAKSQCSKHVCINNKLYNKSLKNNKILNFKNISKWKKNFR